MRKHLGIDTGAHNGISILRKIALILFRFSKPYVEAFAQLMTISHDSEDGIVIFAIVPDHVYFVAA